MREAAHGNGTFDYVSAYTWYSRAAAAITELFKSPLYSSRIEVNSVLYDLSPFDTNEAQRELKLLRCFSLQESWSCGHRK